MQEDLENKSVTLIINSSKLTARTLETAFMKLLRFSRNKLKEHHEEKQDVKPQGKQTIIDYEYSMDGKLLVSLIIGREVAKRIGGIAVAYYE